MENRCCLEIVPNGGGLNSNLLFLWIQILNQVSNIPVLTSIHIERIFSNCVSCNVEQSSGAKPISPVKGGSMLTFYSAHHNVQIVDNEKSILHNSVQGKICMKSYMSQGVQCTVHSCAHCPVKTGEKCAALTWHFSSVPTPALASDLLSINEKIIYGLLSHWRITKAKVFSYFFSEKIDVEWIRLVYLWKYPIGYEYEMENK